MIDCHGARVVAFGIYLHALLGLEVNVAEIAGTQTVDILVFELGKRTVVDRYEETAEDKHHQCHDDRTVEVRPQHAAVADAAAQNGYYLGVTCHL